MYVEGGDVARNDRSSRVTAPRVAGSPEFGGSERAEATQSRDCNNATSGRCEGGGFNKGVDQNAFFSGEASSVLLI